MKIFIKAAWNLFLIIIIENEIVFKCKIQITAKLSNYQERKKRTIFIRPIQCIYAEIEEKRKCYEYYIVAVISSPFFSKL